MSDDARDARLQEFLRWTSQGERDEIAFDEFTQAIEEMAKTASMLNSYDADTHTWNAEQRVLQRAVSEMVYRVLPRVGMNAILAHQFDLGYALKYGVIQPRADALDAVANYEQLEALAERGAAAEHTDVDRRVEESVQAQAASETAKQAATVVSFPSGDPRKDE